MTHATVPEPSHAVLAQAADWYARLRDGKAASGDRAAWQDWLHAAQEHQAAWRYVEDISRGLAPLHAVADPRGAADALSTATNRLHTRRRVLASVAGLSGSGAIGWLAWREALLPAGVRAWAADHRTGTGEQREIALQDGTRLWLNTASAVDIRFSAHERRVELVAGELFIATGHDASRPFLVDTVHGRMRALGTRFNVRLDAARTQLSVYQGAVEIRTSARGATRTVSAGQQAGFDAGRIAAAEAADAAREAWTQGTLVADDITLGEVVQELRRYRPGHLGVADAVAQLKVYGNFPVQDTDRVLRMLATALPIRIAQPLPWWTTLEARR